MGRRQNVTRAGLSYRNGQAALQGAACLYHGLPVRLWPSVWIGQAVAVADGAAFVFTRIDPAILQDRHDLLDELFDIIRRTWRLQRIAVHGPVLPEIDDLVGHLFRRAENKAMVTLGTSNGLARPSASRG